jgi:ABC-type multidrug transport system permease subunit
MCLSGNSLGFFIGSLFKDQNQAAGIGPMITLPLMAFAGLYNKIRDIPSWISWMAYVTPFRYGLHMILENQYGNLVIDLADGSTYDYRADLEIHFSFFENALIAAGVAFCFYFIAFMVLKRLSGKLSS